jgi:hypothetical protein
MQRLSAQQKLDHILSFWTQKTFHDPLWRNLKSHAGLNAAEAGAQSHSNVSLHRGQTTHLPSTKWVGKVFKSAARFGGPGSLAAAILPAAGLASLAIRSLIGNPRKDAAVRTAQRLFQNSYQEPARRARIESFSGGAFNPDTVGRFRAGGRSTSFGASSSSGATQRGLSLNSAARSGQGAANGGAGGNTGQSPSIAITVHALDAKSLLDRSADIANALRSQLQLGHPVADEIRQSVQMG